MAELCIDFGGTAIKVGILDSGVVLVAEELTATGARSDLESVEAAVRRLVAELPAETAGLRAAGIALPGIVDRTAGRLVKAHGKYSFLADLDLREWALTVFGLPAVIENDARAALLGEVSRFGRTAEPDETDAVIITLGTGIGTAALVGGILLRGAHDHAGVLGGHVTVDIDADVCLCGNVGCAESLASTWAIDRALRAHPDAAASSLTALSAEGKSVGLKEVIYHAQSQDAVAQDLLERFIRVWGATIVTLCHAYDPNVVIVSGGVMRSNSAVLPELERYVHAHLWTSSFRPPLSTPQNPELSVLRGLSAIVSDAIESRSITRGE
jgi:glucokinase